MDVKKEDPINIKLVIEYDGKNYFGWQRQSNKPTIQETIEKSLQLLFPGDKIRLTGAGRTDTGVHALGQTANFFAGPGQFKKLGKESLLRSLNAILPDDISVNKIETVNAEFHSRYSAISRTYRYYISLKKHGLNGSRYYFLKTKFDIDLAKEFCKLLIGRHSFKPFCKNREDTHGFLSDVSAASVKKSNNGVIIFEITANRFLHSMVRAITGVLISVASGKISLDEFNQKFRKGELLRIQYVPSNALVLYKIKY